MSLPYSVLALVPDFNTVPQYGASTAQDMVRNAYGPAFVGFPQVRPDLSFKFAFTLTSVEEIDGLEEFFRACSGRAHPFYLPSWRRDLPDAVGSAGSHYLTVDLTDYTADHLTDPATRADHWGRQLFIWQPGHALWTDRIVSATEDEGLTVLDLERPLPFSVDPEISVCGWLHLARFAEDELTWEYLVPDVASLSITFQGLRQHVDIEQELAVTEIQQYAQRGFILASQAVAPALPASNRWSTALGPDVIGTPQVDPFTEAWVVWEEDGDLRIKAGSSITYPDTSGTLSSLTGGDVRSTALSLAFNADAEEVIAIEKPGTVELRHAGGTVTFPGRSPVLVQNRLIYPAMLEADCDVVCYYIKPGEARIFTRFERDAYATERVAARLPVLPLELKASTAAGNIHTLELLDVRFQRVRLVSPSFAP